MVSAVQQCWTLPAGCPSGQREQTVNLSRKLRRFEPFTRHTSHNGPVTSKNRSPGRLHAVRLRDVQTDGVGDGGTVLGEGGEVNVAPGNPIIRRRT